MEWKGRVGESEGKVWDEVKKKKRGKRLEKQREERRAGGGVQLEMGSKNALEVGDDDDREGAKVSFQGRGGGRGCLGGVLQDI